MRAAGPVWELRIKVGFRSDAATADSRAFNTASGFECYELLIRDTMAGAHTFE